MRRVLTDDGSKALELLVNLSLNFLSGRRHYIMWIGDEASVKEKEGKKSKELGRKEKKKVSWTAYKRRLTHPQKNKRSALLAFGSIFFMTFWSKRGVDARCVVLPYPRNNPMTWAVTRRLVLLFSSLHTSGYRIIFWEGVPCATTTYLFYFIFSDMNHSEEMVSRRPINTCPTGLF